MRDFEKFTPKRPDQDHAPHDEKSIWDSLTNQPSWEEHSKQALNRAANDSRTNASEQEDEKTNQEGSYVEKPLKRVDFSDLPNIEISDSHAKKIHPNVNARQVTATDAEGDKQSSMQMFLGMHDPVKMELENGVYVSGESMAEAIEASLTANPDNVTYVRHHETGEDERFAGQERAELAKKIVLEALDSDTSLLLSDNEKITNQEAKLIAVRDEDATQSPAGSLMLGNKRVEMPNGAYLSAEDVQSVMEEYFMQIPTDDIIGGGGGIDGPGYVDPNGPNTGGGGGGNIDQIGPTPPEEMLREPEHQTVTKRRPGFEKIAAIISAIVVGLMITGMLNSCIGPDNREANLPDPAPIEYQMPDIGPLPDGDIPEIELTMPDDTPPAPEEAMEQKDALDPSKMEIGSLMEAKAGVPYGEASDRAYDLTADDQGEVGNQLPPGTYQVEAFSALVNGQIAKVTRQEGEKLSDFIARTSQELGVPEDQIEAQYHLVETGENQGEWVGWRGLDDAGDISLIETGEQ